VTDETIRGLQDVVHRNAQANFGHDFVGIFLVDLVLDLIVVLLVEFVWRDLHQIRKCSLLMLCAALKSSDSTYQDEHLVKEKVERAPEVVVDVARSW
jgi:hypothetical protein